MSEIPKIQQTTRYIERYIEHKLFPVHVYAVVHDLTDDELIGLRTEYAKKYRCSEIDFVKRSFKIKAARVVVDKSTSSKPAKKIFGIKIHLKSCWRDGIQTIEILEDGIVYAWIVCGDNNKCVIHWKIEPSDKNSKQYIESIAEKLFSDVFLLAQIR